MGHKLGVLGLRRIHLIISFAVLLIFPAVTKGAGEVSGYVFDETTGEPLAGAHVQLVGTIWGTVTDNTGGFEFTNLPAGRYRLKADFLGYGAEFLEIAISGDNPSKINIFLSPKPIDLPQVVVEAEAFDIRVFNREDIRRVGANDLSTFLAHTGEVNILDRGGARESTISIRGSNSNQVAVYLDGYRLNDPQTGQVDLKGVPLNAIEKVVVRPNSDLTKGGSALGGSIELYSGEAKGKTLRMGVGSFGSRSCGFDFSKAMGRHNLSVSYSLKSTDGDFTYSMDDGIEKKRLNDDYTNRNLYMKYGYDADSTDIEIIYHHLGNDRGAPGGVENPFLKDRIIRRVDGTHLKFDRRFNRSGFRSSLSFYETVTDNESYLFYGGEYIFNPSHHRSIAVEAVSEFTRTDSLGERKIGLSYRHDRVSSTSFTDTEQRRDLGFYLQREMNYRNIRLSSTVRCDNYSDVGYQISTSNSIKAAPFFFKNLSMTAHYSREFNLPTFNQLFWAENVFAAPNPELEPERAENYDMGFDLNHRGLFLRAVYFHRRINNIIIWRQSFTENGQRQWKPFNTDLAVIKGLEVAARWAKSWMLLSGSATLSDPRNMGETYQNKFLTFRPQLQTTESFSLERKPMSFTLTHRYLSKRYTLETNTKYEPAVSLFDTSIGYDNNAFGWRWETVFRIENLTDKSYCIVTESPMPGRSYHLYLTVEL